MSSDQKSERERIREALRAGSCPPVEQLEKHGQDPLLKAHVQSCARCQTELRLLTEFQKSEEQADEVPAVEWVAKRLSEREKEIFPVAAGAVTAPATPWWKLIFATPRLRMASMALASVVLVIGVTFVVRQESQPKLSYEPGGPERSPAIELLDPAGPVTAPPAVFRWRPAPGAVRYELRVTAVDRGEVWRASSDRSETPVPEDVRRTFAERRTLRWEVVAYGADGTVAARSAEREFRLP